jgi:hypothetical protein
VRNVSPVRINELRISAGSPTNSTDAFIELYNAGDHEVDISGFTLTEHAVQEPVFSSVEIPTGTRLAAHGFYLLGLANSGLVVPAHEGDVTVHVRSTDGMSVGDVVEIGTGSAAETRRIVRVGTAAGLAAPPRSRGGRPGAAGGATTVWQPVPDGPVITIPVGSTDVPVASVAGFEVGQKMAIGYGATYPTVANAVEKYEVVTVTGVGKPGTQAYLSASAKAGDTNLKVSSVENISVGDEIRLDIDSKGHGIETVTVTRVGTPSVRSTFGGPLKDSEDPGTGLDLAEPLKFDHASNLPFSVRGTGIRFEPATAFAHSSNEPVLPLGTGVTLDRPLSNDHAIDAAVRDAEVTTAGYQGDPAPDQWFGGPAPGPRAGTLVLRDAAGRVVDSQNYGALVDPWAAEGYQAVSGAGEDGCSVPAPDAGRFGFSGARGGTPPASPNRSAGRFPDGLDKDSNCTDFRVQAGASLAAASAVGANNIKVTGVDGFAAGHRVVIDAGAHLETAVIATVGTAGATTLDAAAEAGAAVIPVASPMGFREGQTITIDRGANQETAVVTAIRRRFTRGRRDFALTLAGPLARAHPVGVEVSGSGITLTAPLRRTHDSGAPVANGVPTPGAPNRYY